MISCATPAARVPRSARRAVRSSSLVRCSTRCSRSVRCSRSRVVIVWIVPASTPSSSSYASFRAGCRLPVSIWRTAVRRLAMGSRILRRKSAAAAIMSSIVTIAITSTTRTKCSELATRPAPSARAWSSISSESSRAVRAAARTWGSASCSPFCGSASRRSIRPSSVWMIWARRCSFDSCTRSSTPGRIAWSTDWPVESGKKRWRIDLAVDRCCCASVSAMLRAAASSFGAAATHDSMPCTASTRMRACAICRVSMYMHSTLSCTFPTSTKIKAKLATTASESGTSAKPNTRRKELVCRRLSGMGRIFTASSVKRPTEVETDRAWNWFRSTCEAGTTGRIQA